MNGDGEEPASSPAPEPAGTTGGATVLLVDDEDAVRGPTADRLRELGYSALEAEDGPAALRILASARPDLLVTDVGLPGMEVIGKPLALETLEQRVAALLEAGPRNLVGSSDPWAARPAWPFHAASRPLGLVVQAASHKKI